MFGLYKVITIELHWKSDVDGSNNDFFDCCPSCDNEALMKSEYQAMTDSIRECLPLMNRLNGSVIFHRDPIRHEHINSAHKLVFLEKCLKIESVDFHKEEKFFILKVKLVDLVPEPYFKYNNDDSDPTHKTRSFYGVLNGNPSTNQWS